MIDPAMPDWNVATAAFNAATAASTVLCGTVLVIADAESMADCKIAFEPAGYCPDAVPSVAPSCNDWAAAIAVAKADKSDTGTTDALNVVTAALRFASAALTADWASAPVIADAASMADCKIAFEPAV